MILNQSKQGVLIFMFTYYIPLSLYDISISCNLQDTVPIKECVHLLNLPAEWFLSLVMPA